MITIVVGVAAAGVALVVGLVVGRAVQRRSHGLASATAEDVVDGARREACEFLERAETEARALAETYRDREEAHLEHRHSSDDILLLRCTHRSDGYRPSALGDLPNKASCEGTEVSTINTI